MSTSVRLPLRVEEALASYCVDRQLTKSEVITAAVSAYLKAHDEAASGGAGPQAAGGEEARPSPIFQAFAQAGLIGAVGQADTHEPKTPAMTNPRVREAIRRQLLDKQQRGA